MRNPWLDFASVPLGEIFRKYGGGGHQRVGSVIVTTSAHPDPERLLGQLLRDIVAYEAEMQPVRGALA